MVPLILLVLESEGTITTVALMSGAWRKLLFIHTSEIYYWYLISLNQYQPATGMETSALVSR
jgi:hypothetical protein